jgi:threonylcarbamoyladenosine tRNA methylthiotransferase MtaB
VRTFCVQTLGCKVNHYESEQIASLLRSWGLVQTDAVNAELRIVNTCSVTTDAASKSRQSVRRAVRLPVLQSPSLLEISKPAGQRVLVTGCWATSNPADAAAIPGVDAVLTHRHDVALRLQNLLRLWGQDPAAPSENLHPIRRSSEEKVLDEQPVGTQSLPLLSDRQSAHQRAFLKIQDGCDAHCTYCIIPTLRPALWSKSPADVLTEARRMVEAGHVEIVLTGIFLSAYGQPTALRRRQIESGRRPLANLIESLCEIPGLLRVRLSSLEPGDLDDDLLSVLRSHHQVVPHFHLPLQSGSDRILRCMNRQYRRGDYLQMIDKVQAAFDRPAITTDIIAGFPGETEEDFRQTLDVARHARFIHIHAFPFSARPGTAAARWKTDFVDSKTANDRIEQLRQLSSQFSQEFRNAFLGENVHLLVERDEPVADSVPLRHGRCERYFDIHFSGDTVSTGDLVTVRIDRVTPRRTFGTLMEMVPV